MLSLFLSYALTLRIMLANLRRKVGLSSVGNSAAVTPGRDMPMPQSTEGMMVPPGFVDTSGVAPPFTMEELGFTAWPSDRGAFNPSSIPAWLQEQVRPSSLTPFSTQIVLWQSLTDLGLPMNGSDGVFIPLHSGGWVGDFAPMPEAW